MPTKVYFNRDIPPSKNNQGIAAQLYWENKKKWHPTPEVLYPGRGIWVGEIPKIGKALTTASKAASDAVWDNVYVPAGKALKFLGRILVIVAIFAIFVGVLHLNPIFSLLVACGIGVTDILRAVGLSGPKKKDKDGKDIPDFW